jgi:hypothetical protein
VKAKVGNTPAFGHRWIAVAVIVLAAAAGIFFAVKPVTR